MGQDNRTKAAQKKLEEQRRYAKQKVPHLFARAHELYGACYAVQSFDEGFRLVRQIYEEAEKAMGEYPADAVYLAFEPVFIAGFDVLKTCENWLKANGYSSEIPPELMAKLAEEYGQRGKALKIRAFATPTS